MKLMTYLFYRHVLGNSSRSATPSEHFRGQMLESGALRLTKRRNNVKPTRDHKLVF